jgi:AraC-like DNA-binding protein
LPTAPPSVPFRCWHQQPRSSAALLPWPEALHPQALCLHLNFTGQGFLGSSHSPSSSCAIPPQSLAWARGFKTASRPSTREKQECLTLVFPDRWLQQHLAGLHHEVTQPLRSLVSPAKRPAGLVTRPLSPRDQHWARSLMAPHLCEGARALLDSTRLTDFLLSELFLQHAADSSAPTPLSRAERIAMERVEKIQSNLLNQLDDPPDLEELAAAAGCSPHYLSRTFAQVTGVPLMLWIRRARIDRAASLIADGRCNVSEAALEVGYRSFSHFTRAFQIEKGVPPSKWVSHLARTQSPTKPANKKP